MLLQCPAIPTKLHLQYNVDEKKIYFTECTVAPTNSVTTETQIQEPTPKEIESNPPNADLTDTPLPPRKTYYTNIEEYSFTLFQHTVIPFIRIWASTTEAPHHHFFLTWKSWEQNITEDSAFPDIQKWTKIQHLQDYMEYLQACPAIPSTLSLTWDPRLRKIVWERLPLPTTQPSTEFTMELDPTPIPLIRKTTGTKNTIPATTQLCSETNQTPENADDKKSFDNIKTEDINQRTTDLLNIIEAQLNELRLTLDAKISNLETKLTQDIANFTSTYKKIVAEAKGEMDELNNKFSYFNTRMDERVDTAGSRISQTIVFQQT